MSTNSAGLPSAIDQNEAPVVQLGNLVLDKDLIDEHGRRAGKVDDLVLEVDQADADGFIAPPEVVALISGPFGVTENLPRWVKVLARELYRFLGIDSPRPVRIPWEDIIAIDVVVHVKIDREQWRLLSLQDAVTNRFIRHLPGAFVGCDEEEGLYAATVSPDRGSARRDP